MKKEIIGIILLLFYISVKSQISSGGIPLSFTDSTCTPQVNINTFILPFINNDSLIIEDEKDSLSPFRFAKGRDIDINLLNEGTVDLFDNGDKIWRLRISSVGAFGLIVFSDDFYIPKGGKLFIYNENKSHVLGAFTQRNNKPHGEFATAVIESDTIILEYYEPAGITGTARMSIDGIGHVYRDIFSGSFTFKAKECRTDVHCPEGILYRNQVRSVVLIKAVDKNDDAFWCSGALLNQAVNDNDLKAYVLSANHCFSNDDKFSKFTFYFNYQRPGCGGPSYIFSEYTVTGCSLVANRFGSDFALLELDEIPQGDYNIHFAGWDYSGDNSYSGVGIHHPKGDDKSVAAYSKKTKKKNFFGIKSWKVKWDDPGTEQGSSGSPLFDENHRVIGQLAGKPGNCNKSEPYGRFDISWDKGNQASKRLKNWLDPNNANISTRDGQDPCYDNVVLEDRFLRAGNLYQPDNSVTIQASNQITAAGNNTSIVVAGNADYTFRAGNRIVLKPGFRTVPGARFHAYIGECERIADPSTQNYLKTAQGDDNDSSPSEKEQETITQSASTIYPNPVSNSATIIYSIEKRGPVKITLYNIFGQITGVLADKSDCYEGAYELNLNAGNLDSGMYYYVIRANGHVVTKKFIVLK